MEHRFQVEKRTRKDAKGMIMALALYGNHHHESEWDYLHTTRHVEEFLAAGGYTLGELIEECRDKDSQVPLLENLLSTSGWTIMDAPGVEMSYTDAEGNEVQKMPEAGTFSMVTDAALFEKAVDDFERAIAKMSYTEYLSASPTALRASRRISRRRLTSTTSVTPTTSYWTTRITRSPSRTRSKCGCRRWPGPSSIWATSTGHTSSG